MNITEAARAQILMKSILLSQNVAATTTDTPNWKAVAARIAILALGYGAFFALKRKFCPPQRNVSVSAQLSRSPRRHEEGEVCPICLEPPRDGVRPGCGHRLCARCLLRYCEAHSNNKRSRPPPCPLCRMPLVSVTLIYDQSNLSPSDRNGSDTVDPAIVQWINRFNASNGLHNARNGEPGFISSVAMITLKLILVLTLIALLAKLEILSRPDLAVYRFFFLTGLGMILLICLWFKCSEQAALELDY